MSPHKPSAPERVLLKMVLQVGVEPSSSVPTDPKVWEVSMKTVPIGCVPALMEPDVYMGFLVKLLGRKIS